MRSVSYKRHPGAKAVSGGSEGGRQGEALGGPRGARNLGGGPAAFCCTLSSAGSGSQTLRHPRSSRRLAAFSVLGTELCLPARDLVQADAEA